MMTNKLSVFTKPWRELSVDELGAMVKKLGFDAIEFPLRAGYQVEPDNAETDLPKLTAKLKNDYGLTVESVASGTTENIFAACQAAGIPIIRIMFGFSSVDGYMKGEAEAKKRLESLVPLCEKYGVQIGIQQHYGYMVSNSMEMRHLVEGFDPKHIGLIWDAAHSGLAGEVTEQALDIVWEYLCMANFKTAMYRRVNGPEAPFARWERYFTTGRNGLCNWDTAIKVLNERGFKGTICLPAEYTDEPNVLSYTEEDIKFVKSLMAKY